MKKLLTLAGILALTATVASAQFRNAQAQNPAQVPTEGFLLTDDAQPMMEMTAAEIQAAIKANRTETDGPVARYRRPAGVYYNPYYTRDDQSGTWGYNAPQLHVTPYVPYTFMNNSTGAESYAWRCLHKAGWSTDTVTSTETDFTIDYITAMADSVPNLTATAGDASSYYFLQGIDNSNAIKRGAVFAYPDWQYSTSSTANVRHAWETPNYWALRHPQFDASLGAATYFTMNNKYKKDSLLSAKAYSFGTNSAGRDHVATVFEKPSYPYILKNVGVRYQSLAWDSTATNAIAEIRVYVYEVDEIPAYQESTYATITPGTLIAEGSASLSYALSSASAILTVPVSNNGVKPEISNNIMVVVTGYNDPDNNMVDFTLTVSRDLDDEGYGEMGYQGVTTSSGVVFRGINNNIQAGWKTVPSIFIETERPWLTTNSSVEDLTRNFAAEGETYKLELFAYHNMSEWTTTGVPSWINIDMEAEDGSELGYSVNANITAQPLPAGTDYREATIRFAYPGAYLDYTVTQGTEVVGKPGDANEDGKVDVNDVTTIINYILQKNPTPFNFNNANVNGDETVDVMDVTLIIDMILHPNA